MTFNPFCIIGKVMMEKIPKSKFYITWIISVKVICRYDFSSPIIAPPPIKCMAIIILSDVLYCQYHEYRVFPNK